jgi:fatty acid desaturase
MESVVSPPYRTNILLTAAALAIAAIQLVIVPLLLMPESGLGADLLAVAIAVLLSLTTPFVRALLHEAIHSRLASGRGWNTFLGRALAVTSGISFDANRLGHMTHHRFPRHAMDRADIIEPGANRVTTTIKFYLGLTGGLYIREILVSLLMLAPRPIINWVASNLLPEDDAEAVVLHGALRRGLDRRLSRIRVDATFIVLIYAVSFYLYGVWWWVLVLGVALRGLIVSVQDNVAHYDTPAVLGAPAHNTRTMRWAALFMLNSNLHGVHHDHPDVPWDSLPNKFRRDGGDYSGGYFRLLAKQFSGPVPAPETDRS